MGVNNTPALIIDLISKPKSLNLEQIILTINDNRKQFKSTNIKPGIKSRISKVILSMTTIEIIK